MAAADGADAIAKKRSDLPVRVASAVVMVAVAGAAFWLGGWVLTAFILMAGLGIFAEYAMLVLAFESRRLARAVWLLLGGLYIGFACFTAQSPLLGDQILLVVLCSVIAVDVGAYFAGRTFGGPRIAQSISPSKTWAGLGGGILAACALYLAVFWEIYLHELAVAQQIEALHEPDYHAGVPKFFWLFAVALGSLTAIVAQSGDFFESWMKRRAGVKDSGRLIPGHGGLFDRTDGLIAVLFVIGVLGLITHGI